MANVVLFGLRDFASLAHFYLKYDSPHEVVAFTVDRDFLPADPTFEGLPVVPFDELENRYPPTEFAGFAPLSHQGMNRVRQGVYERFKQKGYRLISYISSRRDVLSRHADRRQLFSPRRQHDSAIRDDRKQCRAVERKPHRTSQHDLRSCFLHVARRIVGTLHGREVLFLRRQCDGAGWAAHRRRDIDWNGRDRRTRHRALVGLQRRPGQTGGDLQPRY